MTSFDIEIDFENYSVPEDRAAAIRAEMAEIKSKTWLATLCDWVEAEGQLYQPYGEQTELGGTEIGAPLKRIAWPEDHALKNLEVTSDTVETEIRIGGKRFLCLQKLPKGDEVLVSHYDTTLLTEFSGLEPELHEQLKVFQKAKSEKQKAFQARFNKNT